MEKTKDLFAFKIGLASDHGGYKLKTSIYNFLTENNINAVDFGSYNEISSDYPDYIGKMALAVSEKKITRGIGICRSGLGACIVANKALGVRAALCANIELARLSRMHNDANVIIFPSDYVNKEEASSILQVWLETEFLGGRHQRRVDKIHEFERRA